MEATEKNNKAHAFQIQFGLLSEGFLTKVASDRAWQGSLKPEPHDIHQLLISLNPSL